MTDPVETPEESKETPTGGSEEESSDESSKD